jgi:hypothetical protein
LFIFAGLSKASAQNDWKNSTVFEINKEPGHASVIPVDPEKTIPDFEKTATPFVQMLNGNWKFNWSPKPGHRPLDFYKLEVDVSYWKELPVLSNWELYGYGRPIYINSGYPFKVDPPSRIKRKLNQPKEKIMDRRKFLNYTVPATGAVLIAPGIFNVKAFPRIGTQFPDAAESDMTINGNFKVPVVGLAPLDKHRVEEIVFMLTAQPKGFGEPCTDRENWDKLKASDKYTQTLKEAGKIRTEGIPAWDENLYMGFFTKGDSQSGKDLLAKRIRALVTLTWAECIENNGAYIAAIEKALQEIIFQKTWVNPRNYNEKNYNALVELSTASYAHNIAQVVYLVGSKLKPETRKQAIAALYQRAFNPLLKTIETQNKDHNWITGTSNVNAVCLSGVTCAALTVIPDKTERATFVAIAERYIKNFVAGFLDDGYCTEGLDYFNYGFGRYITLRENLLQATEGKLDLFKDNPKIIKIAWFLPNMEIINGVYPAIADCRQYSKPSGAILHYVSKNLGMGLKTYELMSFEGNTSDLMADVMNVFPNSSLKTGSSAQSEGEIKPRAYFDVAGILTVRPTRLHPHAISATLKGGNNNEHHNHNDLGSFTLVVGDEILVGDPGSIPYTAETFSAQRYEYKSLGSYGHPVPLVSGQQQRPGAGARAKVLKADFSDKKDVFTLDLASAYAVPGLQTLIREFSYSRNKTESLQVTDEFEFTSPQTFETALITRGRWKKVSENLLLIEGKTEKLLVTISSSQGAFTVESEEISEEKGVPYTRIGISIKKPVMAGKISIKYKKWNGKIF